jgi:hypothetical protein
MALQLPLLRMVSCEKNNYVAGGANEIEGITG